MKPPILMLAHRIPYPPDKGDKLRAYQWLRGLSQRYRVHLGCLMDDPEDARHLVALGHHCASLCVVGFNPTWARLKSLRGLMTGQPLTLPYFYDARLARWVGEVVGRERIDRALVFCSAMVPYLRGHEGVACYADFVDVDSDKWAQYARSGGLLARLYRREAARLLAFEKEAAHKSRAVFFVSDAEAELFRAQVGAPMPQVQALGNGVDSNYFSLDARRPDPYAPTELPLVFTGVMDYRPNIDAVCWFAKEVLPRVQQQHPAARLYVVGMKPAPAVRALAGPAVVVTGRVEDVRPYLQHARVAVAPLRLARGVQNKVLEAMSMARAVVTTPGCARALRVGEDALAVAEEAGPFSRAVSALLAQPARAAALGEAARARVQRDFNWDASCAKLVACLEGASR